MLVIYLFHGSDIGKVRAQAFLWIKAAHQKEPNLSYVRLAKEELSSATLEEFALSGSLFAKRMLVLLDDPFAKTHKSESSEDENQEDASLVEDYLDMLAKSDNAIVILAPKLTSAKVKKIASKAVKVYGFEEREREFERGFNSSLVNALQSRDREKLWLEVVRTLRQGDAPEATHGLLHWKARDLLEKGGRSWSLREARFLSLALLSLLQRTRQRGEDLGRALERFALSL